MPEHTVNFLRLILCSSMLVTLSNPLIISVHATGRLKRFQAIEGTMLLSIVPIAYLLLKFFGIRPEYVFCVHIGVEMCTQYARMRIVLPMIKMRVADYVKEAIAPLLKVVVLAPVLPLAAYFLTEQSVATFFLVCLVSVLSVSACVYFIGCTKREQEFATKKISAIISKLKR